jgi:hypothetical protein
VIIDHAEHPAAVLGDTPESVTELRIASKKDCSTGRETRPQSTLAAGSADLGVRARLGMWNRWVAHTGLASVGSPALDYGRWPNTRPTGRISQRVMKEVTWVQPPRSLSTRE